jgi:hypothetical protein
VPRSGFRLASDFPYRRSQMPTVMTPTRKTPAAVRARREANSSGVMSSTARTGVIPWKID